MIDNPKYLVIIALVDGQNFSVPDGSPDKVEATVYAEARFNNESILRTDPVRLNSSNPRFNTELAWQLDKKVLHQLRIERKAIRLQVFMQTHDKRKAAVKLSPSETHDRPSTSSRYFAIDTGLSGEEHKVELVGYTVLDLRSARPRELTKYQWYPLLNPRFRKSSYNRPEIQLAVTLSSDEDICNNQATSPDQSLSMITQTDDDAPLKPLGTKVVVASDGPSSGFSCSNGSTELDTSADTKLYTTCIGSPIHGDGSNSQLKHQSITNCSSSDQIIDNDIIIRFKEGIIYIYDAKHPHKFTINDCDECYELTITIRFATHLNLLVKNIPSGYFFSTNLFGSSLHTKVLSELTCFEPRDMIINIRTTHSGVLATYFELYPNLDIKLQRSLPRFKNDSIGLATIQLNQLCSLDTTCRSIEGVFAIQPPSEHEPDIASNTLDHPSIGVTVVLKKMDASLFHAELRANENPTIQDCIPERIDLDCDEFEDTHQLTIDDSRRSTQKDFSLIGSKASEPNAILMDDKHVKRPTGDDHHYCFTIDLKEFSYTRNQRLIPTLRELVIRYSYPFFGYKDTITTEASTIINDSRSIVPHGFCEFNFATNSVPLLIALKELPLELEMIAADQTRWKELNGDKNPERVVATCSINLAEILGLSQESIELLATNPICETTWVPIFGLNDDEIGHLQISLSLRDLGQLIQKSGGSNGSLAATESLQKLQANILGDCSRPSSPEISKVDYSYLSEAKKNLESWKEEMVKNMHEEFQRRDGEILRRLYQRIEAKEARRDQEFRRKMDDLCNLERKFKDSLSCVASLEKMLLDSLEHLKTKSVTLDKRLDLIELKISQVPICSSACKLDEVAAAGQWPHKLQPHKSFDDDLLKQVGNRWSKNSTTAHPIATSKQNGVDRAVPRRSSLRTGTTGASAGQIPVATRSLSLVRRSSDASAIVTKIVKRNSGTGSATVVNETNPRARPNSKVSLSRENQEKLVKLRKEKAELLKRGCKPSDELIREINLLIEKLAL